VHSHFYIYDNESEIKVSECLIEYINKGLVTVELIIGQQKQLVAYEKCLKEHGHNTKWLAYIDIDEYIVIKNKSVNIAEFLSPYKKFGGGKGLLAHIWLQWPCYPAPGPTIKQFYEAFPEILC
jgi:hypothetical protein